MTNKEISQSIKLMKIQLTKRELIEHWLNLFFLLIPLGFIGFELFYNPVSIEVNLVYWIIEIGIILLILNYKFACLKLVVYKADLSEEQFKKANQAAAILNEWKILSNGKGYFSAIKETGWQWDGIKITAILKNGRIYLNSMANPSIRSNPFTFRIDKKNRLQLIRQYELGLAGENVVELAKKEIEKRHEEFWKESEWSLKNVFKRIVGYGLSIPLIALGICIIATGELKAIVVGITLVGVCSVYIYQDVKVIIEKRKRKKPGYNRR